MSTTPAVESTIPPSQRLRLKRSTRKLEALLGETPLAEIIREPQPQPSTKRESTTSLAGRIVARDVMRSRTNPRPVLVVRVPSSTPSATDAMVSPGATASPLSPTSGIGSNSPVTPSPPFLQGAIRRRRMGKLSRMLGENIPPELVFTSGNQGRRRRESVLDTMNRRASALPQPICEGNARDVAASPGSSVRYSEAADSVDATAPAWIFGGHNGDPRNGIAATRPNLTHLTVLVSYFIYNNTVGQSNSSSNFGAPLQNHEKFPAQKYSPEYWLLDDLVQCALPRPMSTFLSYWS
ncbi:hypothetical protein DFH07DRAFT_777964 [Mycena maculata]|uniref:Uncharacterized protein n=1 Tax=Mycena maculata TaxID=230809 RepID=A0AAD7IF94_9AGAR|nr:hypothetical protein DFH07DRAFT_777964 [Mycena maculata]